MAELSPLVWQWIQKAEEDWEAAGLLSALPSQASSTCFHSQQCVEKLLKASLLAAGAEIPRIHELVVLSEQLGAVDATWEWDPDGLDSLSTAAVASRYPGYAIGASDVAAALADAAAVRRALLLRLGIPQTSLGSS